MAVKGILAFTANAYNPIAYNPNAFNQVVYSRVESRTELLFFARRPASGLSRLEDVVASSGVQAADDLRSADTLKVADAMTALAVDSEVRSNPGAVVPFLESCYPMAVMFNTATGAWTSAQAQAAVAAADRTNVFQALESIDGQDYVPVVVESPRALEDALRKVSATSKTALVLASVAPMCMDVRVVDAGSPSASPIDIYEAAVKTSSDHRLVVSPFAGLKASQREILCDGIVVDGKVVFAAFSEKVRVDPDPPYHDRRIVTIDRLEDATRDRALDVAVQVARKLGVRHCVFHSEYWLTDQGPQLSDFMTRPGGGFIPEMVYSKFGVDLRAAHVYATFAMTDDLVRIAKSGKDSGRGVAIAALYAVANKERQSRPARDIQSAFAGDKRIVAYSMVDEFSNSDAGVTDLRGALCVAGTDSKNALQYLEEVAGAFGLD